MFHYVAEGKTYQQLEEAVDRALRFGWKFVSMDLVGPKFYGWVLQKGDHILSAYPGLKSHRYDAIISGNPNSRKQVYEAMRNEYHTSMFPLEFLRQCQQHDDECERQMAIRDYSEYLARRSNENYVRARHRLEQRKHFEAQLRADRKFLHENIHLFK